MLSINMIRAVEQVPVTIPIAEIRNVPVVATGATCPVPGGGTNLIEEM